MKLFLIVTAWLSCLTTFTLSEETTTDEELIPKEDVRDLHISLAPSSNKLLQHATKGIHMSHNQDYNSNTFGNSFGSTLQNFGIIESFSGFDYVNQGPGSAPHPNYLLGYNQALSDPLAYYPGLIYYRIKQPIVQLVNEEKEWTTPRTVADTKGQGLLENLSLGQNQVSDRDSFPRVQHSSHSDLEFVPHLNPIAPPPINNMQPVKHWGLSI